VSKKVVLSYEAEPKDLERFSKAFVGVAATPGTTYNIQNAFHSQGYFGVKITPLGSNLALLEGQEDGEVEALLEDAKDWLDQWFTEVRPWIPKDIDLERIVWLRIFGIPAHAWNDEFFARISKPWGSFLNTDDVTNKKLTMDVARILIRTSCQKVVDEFIDVVINGEYFHLRILEDSYGPMRIMVSKPQEQDGRVVESDESEANDGEEDERTLAMAEVESERESEGEGENLLALNSLVNANQSPVNEFDQVGTRHSDMEEREENSNCRIIDNSVSLKENLNTIMGGADVEGGVCKKDNMVEKGGKSVCHEGQYGTRS
jgi:hypothetical protein